MGVPRNTVAGQAGGAIGTRWRPAVADLSLVVAAGLAVGGCGSSNSSSSTPGCFSKAAAAARASAINSSNVSKLGVAWTVPIEAAYGRYATTPVVVNGVVYTQDLESNVMAIELATGKVLWRHTYSSPNGGPDGVKVVSGTVYAATNHAAVALSAATGRQLWSRTLIGNNREGIDMAPGYNHGTVYVSTVPVNPTVGEYLGGAKSTLWALSAQTGVPEWSLPVGVHNGHDHDGLPTENAGPTGAILLKTPLPARTNAPVTIDGDYVITAGSVAQPAGQRMFIVAYRLGATGKLPSSAGA